MRTWWWDGEPHDEIAWDLITFTMNASSKKLTTWDWKILHLSVKYIKYMEGENLPTSHGYLFSWILDWENLPTSHGDLITSQVNVLIRKDVQDLIEQCLEEAVGAVFAGVQGTEVPTHWVGALVTLGHVLGVTQAPGVSVTWKLSCLLCYYHMYIHLFLVGIMIYLRALVEHSSNICTQFLIDFPFYIFLYFKIRHEHIWYSKLSMLAL